MTKEQKFISVVAYVRNAGDQIEYFLDHVMGTVSETFSKCELILVNDGSTDDSMERIHGYFDAHPADYMVSIIRMGTHQGQESSMNAGRDMAIGDYVYEFDDLIVDFEDRMIAEAYRKCLEGQGHDIVAVASSSRMRMTSRWFYQIFNQASGSKGKLGQETFRLLSRRAINRVKSMGTYIPYRKAVYMNCGLSTATLTYQSSQTGMTKHSRKDERAGLAMDSFIYFTDVMEKISLTITGVFFVIAIVVLIYVIESYFTDPNLVSGWVSMMGFISIGFVGLFGLLSIVIKYLSVLVNLVFRHQRYLIEDVEKISKN